jgi:putative ABC transport system permease protein
MRLLHRLVSVVRWITRRDIAEKDLNDELQAFIDMAAADEARNGMTEAEARRRAALRLGGLEQAKERVRGGRHGAWLDIVGRDLRYGMRQIRRDPAFSAIVIATLALGIGVNTAMFSAVDAVLIKSLPYADPDRLVMIWSQSTRDGAPKFFTSPPEWTEWRRLNTVFTDIAATRPGDASLSNDGEPEALPARMVTGNLWNVLGAQPLLGRVFTEEEDVAGARVVVISHGLWQRRFGASPAIVGRTVVLNDTPYEVVGVMPREFYFFPSRDIDVWMPASFSPELLKSWGWTDVVTVGRLKPGVTARQAADAMAALNLRVTAERVKPPRSAVVSSVREDLVGKTSTSLIVLLGATGAVLLIACVNVANLLLSRGESRRREVAMRAALGASRGRLIAQFLIESLALAGFGAITGVAIAWPAMQFLERLVPETMGVRQLTFDWRVLAFSVAISLTAGVIFGLAPALRGAVFTLQGRLRDGGRGQAGGRSHVFQHALIVVETALAVALLATGGVLLQTFQQLRQLDLGLRGDHVLTFVTPLFRYGTFEERVAFVNAELERIRAIPGVLQAAAISRVPLSVNDQSTFYLLTGQDRSEANLQVALTRVVTRDYFSTIGASLREGRFFDSSDVRSDAPAAVVNETFANKHFPGRSPLGERVKFGRLGAQGYWYSIVGVVNEIRERGVAEDLRPAIYRLHEQSDQTNDSPSGFVVRTAVPPASIIPAIREAIWSLDKHQPVARLQTIEDIVSRQLSVPTQNTVLLGAFALLALTLAALGLYGVLSYAVAQRTNEIGVRMALGASGREILLSFGGRGLALTLGGLLIGVALALATARLITTLLYGFEPNYAGVLAAVSGVLIAVAMLASFVPARRASRVDPMIALRQE